MLLCTAAAAAGVVRAVTKADLKAAKEAAEKAKKEGKTVDTADSAKKEDAAEAAGEQWQATVGPCRVPSSPSLCTQQQSRLARRVRQWTWC